MFKLQSGSTQKNRAALALQYRNETQPQNKLNTNSKLSRNVRAVILTFNKINVRVYVCEVYTGEADCSLQDFVKQIAV